MNVKKTMSIVVSLCIMLSCIILPAAPISAATNEVTTTAAAADVAETSANSYGLADNVQDGVIFHAWNWSYDNIKANLKTIAELGFTTIQTSPVQTPKEGTKGKQTGHWWVLYQPASLSIETGSDNALGNKSQLQSMITEAHKYGLKVIVDIVANHLGNASDYTNLCSRSYSMESDIANNWRFHKYGSYDGGSVKGVVWGAIGMPDLNTADRKVQDRVASLLRECVEVGIDGFRFDAAKHIETPNDGDASSQFWPYVLGEAQKHANSTQNGKKLYYYGEILNSVDAGRSYGSYTKFMSITDNTTGNNIRGAAQGRNASGLANSHYNTGQAANKVVLWAESHDTYANDEMESTGCSTSDLNKTWAMVASRKDATALYFARPSNRSGSQLGAADKTGWLNKEVGEVNKFHNYFIGQSEYLSSSGSIAYNERGTSGVILVNASGTSSSVSVSAKKMANGTYTDQISGSTFTVSGGQIKGNIGNTGIAVVYNAVTSPNPTISQQGGSFKTDTITVKVGLSNATSGTYQIDNKEKVTYNGETSVTLGAGLSYGQSTTIKLTATDGSTTSETKSYTFTKKDPNEGVTIYFDNNAYNWSNVYCYVYADESTQNAAWPGVQMTKDSSTGYYTYDVPDNLVVGKVIFAESQSSLNRYPADQEPGMDLNESSMLFSSGNSWKEYTIIKPTQPSSKDEPQPTNPVTIPTTPNTTEPKESTIPTIDITNKILLGDSNLDSKVTIQDATLIQKYLLELVTLNEKQMKAADSDQNQNVSIKDATAIQKYCVGKESNTKVGSYLNDDTVQPTSTEPLVTEPQETSIYTTPITEPSIPTVDKYIYYKDTNNWGSVNAYFWQTDMEGPITWPGSQMESIGNSVYRIVLPDGMDNVVFSSGANQTDDISVPSAGQIYENGSWSSYSGGGSDTTIPPIGDGNYIYFRSSGWGTTFAYVWQEGSEGPVAWPGSQMDSIGNSVFRMQYPENANMIVFSDGNGDQTDDISLGSAGQIYENGSWSSYSG